MLQIGVLAFHGDVSEHIDTTEKAAKKLKLPVKIRSVLTLSDLSSLDGLIIPGGESTTIYKLCVREKMIEEMKKIKAIFGTCAGAIMLAKNILHKAIDQNSLQLMDITVDRNAYGAQVDSFEKEIETEIGKLNAVFIRAPKIVSVGKNIKVLAKEGKEIIACEQKGNEHYYLALTFHPELSTTLFHEYFLKQLCQLS